LECLNEQGPGCPLGQDLVHRRLCKPQSQQERNERRKFLLSRVTVPHGGKTVKVKFGKRKNDISTWTWGNLHTKPRITHLERCRKGKRRKNKHCKEKERDDLSQGKRNELERGEGGEVEGHARYLANRDKVTEVLLEDVVDCPIQLTKFR